LGFLGEDCIDVWPEVSLALAHDTIENALVLIDRESLDNVPFVRLKNQVELC
jgi:hypothetical protein